MTCSKYKNSHYKSLVQFYNTVVQAVATTNTITSPVTLLTGTSVTDTGCALDVNTNSVSIDSSGSYRISAIASVTGIVAGELTIALTLDGVAMPETIKTFSVTAGGTIIVPIETVRVLQTCCNISEHSIGIIAYSDGTGTGTITASGNVIKLA